MVKVIELTDKRTLELPPEIASKFNPADRFVVWVEGDTLHLKKISSTASITKLVEHTPEEKPMSLGEINRVVHKVRRLKKS